MVYPSGPSDRLCGKLSLPDSVLTQEGGESRNIIADNTPQRGPLALTPAELSLYNGTSPSLPILLAIDGTIFDVSASPHTYGPGGSYHAFAGRDASRAFVTGCFEEDLHGDLRGVERMFIPVEDVEEGGGGGEALTSSQKKIRAEQETRESKKKVRAKVENWVAFYRGNKKYFEVGKVVSGSAEGEERKDVPGLCEAAEKARPRRSQLDEEIRKGSGKKVSKPDKGGKPV